MFLRCSVGSVFCADVLFPSHEDGKSPWATPAAVRMARVLLRMPPDVPDSDIAWDLPDVFSIPYGSDLVGRASFGGDTVEFFFEE